MLAAILAIICGASVISCCSQDDEPMVSPTDDSSQFVTLTDVVPDVILEIRYYGKSTMPTVLRRALTTSCAGHRTWRTPG